MADTAIYPVGSLVLTKTNAPVASTNAPFRLPSLNTEDKFIPYRGYKEAAPQPDAGYFSKRKWFPDFKEDKTEPLPNGFKPAIPCYLGTIKKAIYSSEATGMSHDVLPVPTVFYTTDKTGHTVSYYDEVLGKRQEFHFSCPLALESEWNLPPGLFGVRMVSGKGHVILTWRFDNPVSRFGGRPEISTDFIECDRIKSQDPGSSTTVPK